MRLLIATALLALAACSPPAEPPVVTPAPAPVAAPKTPKADATVGGDGSPITLNTVSAAEVEEAELGGELACSFDAGSGPLLIASGNVASDEPAFGVVKVGSYVETVAVRGGFDAMVKGAAFAGKGKTVTIAITGAPTAGGESPPSPATLTYDRMDGATRTITGEWTCGP
jgi:hypothetical protein